jgi:hypothetical protein
MLARPEIGTREHILLWLASRNGAAGYEWGDVSVCPAALYAADHGLAGEWRLAQWQVTDSPLAELSTMAASRETYGELYAAALRLWRVASAR